MSKVDKLRRQIGLKNLTTEINTLLNDLEAIETRESETFYRLMKGDIESILTSHYAYSPDQVKLITEKFFSYAAGTYTVWDWEENLKTCIEEYLNYNNDLLQ